MERDCRGWDGGGRGVGELEGLWALHTSSNSNSRGRGGGSTSWTLGRGGGGEGGWKEEGGKGAGGAVDTSSLQHPRQQGQQHLLDLVDTVEGCRGGGLEGAWAPATGAGAVAAAAIQAGGLHGTGSTACIVAGAEAGTSTFCNPSIPCRVAETTAGAPSCTPVSIHLCCPSLPSLPPLPTPCYHSHITSIRYLLLPSLLITNILPPPPRPLFVTGHVGKFLVPVTRSSFPAVRSAATAALTSLLLVPEVQAQLAASPGGSAAAAAAAGRDGEGATRRQPALQQQAVGRAAVAGTELQ